jgi:3-hydroxyacyl-[acyl-carrier protein] dehydratase/trans-2-decenoyl-[acyl-carrier protein] isomerase
LPTSTKVTYEIDLKRVIARSIVMGLGDGVVRVDGRAIYHATDLKVGLFTSTDGF